MSGARGGQPVILIFRLNMFKQIYLSPWTSGAVKYYALSCTACGTTFHKVLHRGKDLANKRIQRRAR